VGQFEAGLRQACPEQRRRAQPERFNSWSIQWIFPLALSLSKGERFKLTQYRLSLSVLDEKRRCNAIAIRCPRIERLRRKVVAGNVPANEPREGASMGKGHGDRGRRGRLLVLVGLAAAMVHTAGAQRIEEEDLGGAPDIVQPAPGTRHSVRLQDVRFAGDGSLKGLLVNQSGDVVRDVRLLVRYDWRWQNERHPGEDSPGRSQYVTISSDVPALGSLPFEYAPAPPLPLRTDGSFAPSVEIAGYTEVRLKKVLRQPKSLDR
jgi:hypothetical protein